MSLKKNLQKFYNNAPHKCVKPEEMLVDTPYAFTVNPMQQHHVSFGRLEKMDIMVKQFLSRYKSFTCLLYREVSALGRVHYHGIIKIKDIIDFFVYTVPQLMGFCSFEIDVLNDTDIWKKYCMKQGHLWRDPERSRFMVKYAPKIAETPIPQEFLQKINIDSSEEELDFKQEKKPEEPEEEKLYLAKDGHLYHQKCLPQECSHTTPCNCE